MEPPSTIAFVLSYINSLINVSTILAASILLAAFPPDIALAQQTPNVTLRENINPENTK
jgi:hypothetical protein